MKLYKVYIPYGTAVVAANSKEEAVEMIANIGAFLSGSSKEERLADVHEIEIPETPGVIALYQE